MTVGAILYRPGPEGYFPVGASGFELRGRDGETPLGFVSVGRRMPLGQHSFFSLFIFAFFSLALLVVYVVYVVLKDFVKVNFKCLVCRNQPF